MDKWAKTVSTIGINDIPNLELKILNYTNYDKVSNS